MKFVEQSLIAGGYYCGIGAYRPDFGAFVVSKFKEVNGNGGA